MARRLFGARKGRPHPPETTDWPQLAGQLAGTLRPVPEPNGVVPILASALGVVGTAGAPGQAEEDLLERIAAFRAAVSDSLYEASKDYQILCNLTHADLTACDDIVAELRRRLDGNIHFSVIAKLDEVHALVAAHVAAVPSPGLPGEG